MATAPPYDTASPAPSLWPAASATASAILGLVTCLFLVSTYPTPSFDTLRACVCGEAVIVAGAVALWVRYFHRYIDYQFVRRAGPPGTNLPR